MKNMYNRVTRVEQYPVAKREALYTGRCKASIPATLDDPVGDSANVCSRTAGGDKHPVSKRRLTQKLN